jgi:hypothetical protein
VVVLDGATDPDEPAGRNGGWYAHRLADALRSTLTRGRSLVDAVEEAIAEMAAVHRLVPGQSPSSTVAAASWDDEHVHTYVLGDSTAAVVDREGRTEVLTDRRLQDVGAELRRRYQARLADGAGYDYEHQALLGELVHMERVRRNHGDGYWIAEAQPEAARHGLTQSWDRRDIATVVLASDGAAAALTYGLHADWASVATAVEALSAARFLEQVAEAEQADAGGRRWPRSKPADDKTLALIRLS